MRIISPQTKVFLEDVWPRWQKLQADFLAAGISYFALFSLAPLLILLVTVTGYLVSQPRMQSIVLEKVSIWISPEATDLLSDWMTKTTLEKKKNTMLPQTEDVQKDQSTKKGSTWLGLLLLAFGASQALNQTRRILNIVWEVPRQPQNIFKTMFHTGLWNVLMLSGLGILLLAFFAVDAGVAFIWNFFRHYLPEVLQNNVLLLQGFNFITSLCLITLLLCLTYRYVPDAKVRWQDVWAGAITTAVLLALGKVSISIYLSFSGLQSLYGAASSLLILLLSMHVAAHIFIIGAVFTRSWAELHGSRRPATHKRAHA